MLEKRIFTFLMIFVFFSSLALYCSESDEFLLFGFTVKPSPSNLSTSWLISEGGDYSFIGPITGGYEAGVAYKIFDDRAEYHLKTFFNAKYDLIRSKDTGLYVGAGGGLLELLKVEEHESSFRFFFGYQGIIGLKFGQAGKDKFCFEVQFLKSTEKGRDLQISLLAGVRF